MTSHVRVPLSNVEDNGGGAARQRGAGDADRAARRAHPRLFRPPIERRVAPRPGSRCRPPHRHRPRDERPAWLARVARRPYRQLLPQGRREDVGRRPAPCIPRGPLSGRRDSGGRGAGPPLTRRPPLLRVTIPGTPVAPQGTRLYTIRFRRYLGVLFVPRFKERKWSRSYSARTTAWTGR